MCEIYDSLQLRNCVRICQVQPHQIQILIGQSIGSPNGILYILIYFTITAFKCCSSPTCKMCQLSKILQYCCSTILFHGTVARLLIKNYYYIIFDSSLFLSTLSSSCSLFLFSHYFITFTLRLTLINPMEMPCKQSSSSSSL